MYNIYQILKNIYIYIGTSPGPIDRIMDTFMWSRYPWRFQLGRVAKKLCTGKGAMQAPWNRGSTILAERHQQGAEHWKLCKHFCNDRFQHQFHIRVQYLWNVWVSHTSAQVRSFGWSFLKANDWHLECSDLSNIHTSIFSHFTYDIHMALDSCGMPSSSQIPCKLFEHGARCC